MVYQYFGGTQVEEFGFGSLLEDVNKIVIHFFLQICIIKIYLNGSYFK